MTTKISQRVESLSLSSLVGCVISDSVFFALSKQRQQRRWQK